MQTSPHVESTGFLTITLAVTSIMRLESNVTVSLKTHKSLVYFKLFLALCIHGSVQLYHGLSKRYSTVRVCINGTWNKVCGRENSVVDNNLARVVCGQAGYSQYGKRNIIKFLKFSFF